MKNKKHILLVEDEVSLAMIIKDTLEEEEYEVTLAESGTEGLEQYFKQHPDLIVADIMLPGIDGFEMTRRIRNVDKEIPILFLSARSTTDDIVSGFELGANDYIRKPFSLRELVVRIKAHILKSHLEEQHPRFYEIGLYTFYPNTQTLQIAGENETLSFKESEILKLFCESEGHLIHMQDVLLSLWGDDNFYTTRSLHVFITKLRHKLNRDVRIHILNVRGTGYKLICDPN